MYALLLTLALASTPRACYPITQDADRDGYARAGALAVIIPVPGLYCPAGYVPASGDCDDDNRSIHPNQRELPFNGVDDNCRDGADEVRWVYSATPANTPTSARMLAIINDEDAVRAGAEDRLYLHLEYSPLASAELTTVLSPLKVRDVDWDAPFVSLSLGGLVSGDVYRIRIRFLRRDVSAAGGVTYVRVTGLSPWYYTMTVGGSALERARTDIVNLALLQADDSDSGLVGYAGLQRDGTRYGAASDEKWCSEFYAWSAGRFTTVGGDDVWEVLGAFGGNVRDNSHLGIYARPGDYMAVNDHGHSTLLLAYDVSTSPARLWTVEGNYGNRVEVVTRGVETVNALGRLHESMLR
ncbi:putative metal-binding motif-containing protein [Myxococcus faecalis]|uniref:putative metal-binding motif-containing protein n=1 Tax=Myxococcus faecalis TaxID=3115646 RepID=UPI003CF45D10